MGDILRGALYCLHLSITIFKFSMNDPPLAKGDIGGFSKHLNPPLPPFSKGGGANKYMLRVISDGLIKTKKQKKCHADLGSASQKFFYSFGRNTFHSHPCLPQAGTGGGS